MRSPAPQFSALVEEIVQMIYSFPIDAPETVFLEPATAKMNVTPRRYSTLVSDRPITCTKPSQKPRFHAPGSVTLHLLGRSGFFADLAVDTPPMMRPIIQQCRSASLVMGQQKKEPHDPFQNHADRLDLRRPDPVCDPPGRAGYGPKVQLELNTAAVTDAGGCR